MKEKCPEWDLLAKTYIAQMIIAICNMHNSDDTTPPVSSKKITMIKQYLNAHFTEEFSLAKIADELYMNKYYMLCRSYYLKRCKL